MKTFLTRFFVILGVIFFILLCAGAYIWFADPFGVRPLADVLFGNAQQVSTKVVEGVGEKTGDVIQKVEEKATEDKNPSLNAAQERALEVVGIDPAKVPTTITPAQEVCFTEKLGAPRVAEIKAGATPSATEIFQARACIQ